MGDLGVGMITFRRIMIPIFFFKFVFIISLSVFWPLSRSVYSISELFFYVVDKGVAAAVKFLLTVPISTVSLQCILHSPFSIGQAPKPQTVDTIFSSYVHIYIRVYGGGLGGLGGA